MLARLQRFITVLLLVLALGWLGYFYPRSPGLALAGFLVVVFGHAAVLALEFAFAWRLNHRDPAPPPTLWSMLQAWVGESTVAPQVFCWRQPFRAAEVPDQASGPTCEGRRGVVLVHGFFCNRGFWNPWLKRLRTEGHPFIALTLEPVFGSIDAYVPAIDAAVTRITEATGLAPLLVCHSMGGLAARAWLKHMKAEPRVHRIVTIGTPHGGTWLARFGHGHNTRQMRLQSDWQQQLDQGMPEGRHALFTCWYSNCDNIVFPTSTAILAGADNRRVPAAAHVQMAFLPEVMDGTLALLAPPTP
ncbi:alpha/beta fold hydrolase [Polaromonas sp. YR568]|uniref:esterase/lipase family protein n=1 Tax=Polaromonas sp. YR568 TaxID=1855301 RepID=UPI003137B3C5